MKIDYTKLTNTEKFILKLLLNNKEVVNMNMEQLANFTNSSLGSIDRLVKKLDFNGYKEYKTWISKSHAIPKSNIVDSIDINNIINKTNREIKTSLSLINVEFIEMIASNINTSNKIYIYGMGLSSLSCEFFVQKLQSLGKNAFHHSDKQFMNNSLLNADDNTLFIFLSISGNTIELVDAANKINNMNFQKNSYLITLNPEAKLSQLIPNIQVVYKEKTVLEKYDLQSRIQLDVVSRIIMDLYVLKYFKM